jgi:hypothetical protein
MNSGRAAAEARKWGRERSLSHIPLISRDPLGAFEVRQHQDVEQFGAGSRGEGVETLS